MQPVQLKPSNSQSKGSCPPGPLCLWLPEVLSLPKIQSSRWNPPRDGRRPRSLARSLGFCVHTHMSHQSRHKTKPFLFSIKISTKTKHLWISQTFLKIRGHKEKPPVKHLVFHHLHDLLLPAAPMSKFFSLITRNNLTLPRFLPSNLHS